MAKKEAKKLDELFHDTLKDIYFAEKKILATLPKMEKAAQLPELKRAFAKHKTETEGHVARLEEVFAAIDKKPQAKTCDAIVGITDEGAEIMKEYKGSPALDAGLLAAAQAVEHYEISELSKDFPPPARGRPLHRRRTCCPTVGLGDLSSTPTSTGSRCRGSRRFPVARGARLR